MKKLPAVPAYVGLCALMGMAHSTAWTQYLLFQENVAGLQPAHLVLMGTVSELTITLCEVPTGMVADTVSRRLSFVIGLLILGLGFLIQGLFPVFGVVVACSVLWGLGETFISGAREAWIADEIPHSPTPERHAGDVFAQGNTARLLGMFVGIWMSAGFGLQGLQTPIIASGVIFLVLAGAAMLLLPERGFHRASERERASWKQFVETGRNGFRIARGSAALGAIMLMVFFTGIASEGFDRLFANHLNDNLGFPVALPPVVWMAILASIPTLVAAVATVYIRRARVVQDTQLTVRVLTWMHAGVMASVLLFALAPNFAIGVVGLMMGRVLRRVDTPLIQSWTNQHATSEVRATILSFQSQAHGFGEILGGPISATIAAVAGVRAALTSAGVLVLPTVLTLLRARRLESGKPATEVA